MASAFSHAFVALALGKAPRHPVFTWPVLFLGMACSIVPDLDVIGFSFGIQYGDLWGHRGMTHSLCFASLMSAMLTAVCHRQQSAAAQASLFFYLFLCTASHGLLDALTDGGLGVAFFSPFDTSRYFFAFRPVAVSPIGINAFFSEHACQRGDMDLAPSHCRVLDRSRATICAVSSMDREARTDRLISPMEKLTGDGENLPFKPMGWLRVHYGGDAAHSIFTHFPHIYQLDRRIRLLSEIATIQECDKLLCPAHSIPDVFFSDTALSQLFLEPD